MCYWFLSRMSLRVISLYIVWLAGVAASPASGPDTRVTPIPKCSYGGKMYDVGATFYPERCLRCQCVKDDGKPSPVCVYEECGSLPKNCVNVSRQAGDCCPKCADIDPPSGADTNVTLKCSYGGKMYDVGATFYPEKCLRCQCVKDDGKPSPVCVYEECGSLPKNCVNVSRQAGDCCPKCADIDPPSGADTNVTLKCSYGGKMYDVGATFYPEKCLRCQCVKDDGKPSRVCVYEECGSLPKNCVNVSRQAGDCCPKCADIDPPSGADTNVTLITKCSYGGKMYDVGATFYPEKCLRCQCVKDDGKPSPVCVYEECGSLPKNCVNVSRQAGDCCPKCADLDSPSGADTNVTLIPKCSYRGKMYDVGATFYPERCLRCQCVKDDGKPSPVCVYEECGSLPKNCVNVSRQAGDCCPKCADIDPPSGADTNVTLITKCSYGGKMYDVGATFYPEKCLRCQCVKDDGKPSPVCVYEECGSLPKNCVNVSRQAGDCCPKCADLDPPSGADTNVTLITKCSYGGKMYDVGATFYPEKCLRCQCVKDDGKPSPVCVYEECGSLPKICVNVSRQAGDCCPKCADLDSPSGADTNVTLIPKCSYRGKMYDVGATFYPERCLRCQCVKDDGKPSPVCVYEECGSLPKNCVNVSRQAGDCCPKCADLDPPSGAGTNVTLIPKCSYGGKMYDLGATFYPEKCLQCQCVKDYGEASPLCLYEECGSLPDNCAKVSRHPGDCCPKCADLDPPFGAVAVTTKCRYGDKMYDVGEIFSPERCTKCTCILDITRTAIPFCFSVKCDKLPDNCAKVFRDPSDCCPKCVELDPRTGASSRVAQKCRYGGKSYELGELFSPSHCAQCKCTERDEGPKVACVEVECPFLHIHCVKWSNSPLHCCPKCLELDPHGYYLYVPQTGAVNGSVKDAARLTSPVIYLTDGPRCFVIWYYMYGKNIGDLVVSIRGPSSTKDHINEITIIRGNQGDRWMKFSRNISAPDPLVVMIDITLGKGEETDIAIDDISLAMGPCPPDTTTTTATLPPTTPVPRRVNRGFECDFDTDQCQWTSRGINNWVMVKSAARGPTADVSGDGSFMHLDAKTPGMPALFVSPVLLIAKPVCVSLAAYMHGTPTPKQKSRSTLSIYAFQAPDKPRPSPRVIPQNTLVYAKSGDQGTGWFHVDFSIGKPGKYEVEISGIQGVNGQCSLAIDDIKVQDGLCKNEPPLNSFDCTFERNYCGWREPENVKTGDVTWKLRTGSGVWENKFTHEPSDNSESYLYTDNSDVINPSSVAVFISPQLTVKVNQPQCMSLKYLLRGEKARFVIKVKPGGRSAKAVLEILSQDENIWEKLSVEITEPGNIKILLEAHLDGYQGDPAVAVDDISIRPGSCPYQPVKDGDCVFQVDTCGWKQSAYNAIDWTRSSISNLTSDVVPFEHKIELSLTTPSSKPYLGTLLSPMVPMGQGERCMILWYRVLGTKTAKLSVYTRDVTGRKRLHFHRSNESPHWHTVTVKLGRDRDVQIMIEGKVQAVQDRVAVGSITITNGGCS